ncbi:hypothetical protein [Flavobacterium sp.]|uniref:hypothetical protein n=1 Tax=Flavobacterium sp. TaxID=239 RepID=UPI0012274CA5|nr:hypothetical protein [Flavobacterium sp.]RZJ71720.1 MAG: hypothetical protein EOO49_08630 [Flavobacterium sp.]
MSRKIFIAVVFLFIGISACESDQHVENDQTGAKLHQLSLEFIASQGQQSGTERWPPRWFQIVRADAIGAMAGAGIGAFTGPEGAVVGAVIGGVGASVLAAVTTSSTSSPIPGTPGTPGVPLACPDNPYDSRGYWHYQTVAATWTNPSNYLVAGKFNLTAFNNFQENYLRTNHVFTNAQLDAYYVNATVEWCTKFVADMPNDPSVTAKSKVDALYAQGKISLTAKNVMNDYFNSMDAAANLDAFINYSKQAEKLVAQSSYSQLDKIVILNAMAVGRHGSVYWN